MSGNTRPLAVESAHCFLRVDQTSIREFNELVQVSLTVMEHPDEALRPESKGQTDLERRFPPRTSIQSLNAQGLAHERSVSNH
jgi:hypothetical protein